MDCVRPILDFLSSRSQDMFSVLFGHILSLEDNIYLLKREMRELQSIRDDVKREVDAAERQGLTCTNQVRWWLESVDTLGGEVAAIDTGFQRLFRCFGDCPLNVGSRYQLGKRAAEKLAEVRDLKAKAIFNRIADGQVVGRIEEVPITPPVGLDAMLRRLHDYVEGYEVDMVGIYGMGGVGKTTLLKKLNNELLSSDRGFDIVIFLEITKDVNIEMIQRTIGSRLGLRWQENQDPREFSSCILKYLGTKKFVLLVDDMWEPLDLPSVGIPLPNGKQRRKIILTTRVQDICFHMDAQEIVKLECLPWPDAWALFALKARNDFTNCNPLIQGTAEAIVRTCGGLPLALITMGRVMAGKRTVEEWVHGFLTMTNQPWDLPGMKEQVLPRLKLSYDNLATDELRQCFLYCSLYPKSNHILKQTIIDFWFCEGFFGDLSYMLSSSDRGHHIIGLLQAACLIEPVENEGEIKMHPMMRDLALWVASDCGSSMNRWLVQAGLVLKAAPEVERWRQAERISLMDNEIEILPEAPDCPRLLTLILRRNNNLRRFHDSFFLSMRSLKVLDLSFTSIEKLPPAIGMLSELQHLSLTMTKLVSLPTELGHLGKLIHLQLAGTSTLRFIPKGVIARLAPRLQLLGMFDTQIDWKVGGSSGDGVCFEELEAMRHLGGLSISIGNVPALDRLCNSLHLATPTNALHVYECEGMTSLLLPSAVGRSMGDIRMLWITDSSDLQEVIFGSDNDEACFLRKLLVLELRNLATARIVCRGMLLPHALGSLRELRITSCPAIEQLISGVTFAFFGVQELRLHDLPMLSGICSDIDMIFPSLQVLRVDGCPRLRELPRGFSSGTYNLISVRGQKEWWDGLEWQQDFLKLSFEFQELE